MTTQQRAELSVNGWNSQYIEALYEQWLADPGTLDAQWQRFFEGFDLGYRSRGTFLARPVDRRGCRSR